MVVVFTIISATAQAFIKTGAAKLGPNPTLAGLIQDLPLLTGLFLYGIGAVLMILALRHGELSVLWPVISLSYVWVAILSVVIFHEGMNPFKVAGIIAIVSGVAMMGRGAHK
jgi:drug/metabolite transporter (DMT)-like permease